MKLVFATHNQNKYHEVKQLVPKSIELLSLEMIGCHDEISETGDTLEKNAQLKADYVTDNFGMAAFSDDTGLLVDALGGAPGVYSARYAGEQKDTDANINRLLKELHQVSNRKAHFKTVIALNLHNRRHLFSGVVNGRIGFEKQGGNGFGYDPLFIPNGYEKTFAELPLSIKNTISHRALAIRELISFLNTV